MEKELKNISEIKPNSKLNYIFKLNQREKLISYLKNKYGNDIIMDDPFTLWFVEICLHDDINKIISFLGN